MTRPVSPKLPKEGLLVGWSLEGEPRKPLIGFASQLEEGTGSQVLEPILHNDEGHLMTVAPTGAGKGVGCIIPALLRYEGPVVVIDPKGENYAVTARARREMGQRVIALDPFNSGMVKKADRGCFNPLDFLSPRNETLVEDAEMIASTLLSATNAEHAGDRFWPYMGGQLLTLLLLYQLKCLPPADWHLNKTRELLAKSMEDWSEFAEELRKDPDEVLRHMVGLVAKPAESTFGGYWAFAQMQTSIFKEGVMSETIKSSSFSLQELVDGEALSIYIIIPPEKLEAYGALLKVWLAVMISALTNRRSKPRQSTLFLLDEAAQLGEMPQLQQAMTLLRGYGVRVWSFWQDLSQLQGLYPRTWQTLLNNCHVHQFFAPSTRGAAKQTYEVTGLGSPEYLQTLQPGEMVLSLIGDQPVIARVPNYREDMPFSGLFDKNPFYRRAGRDRKHSAEQRVFRRSKPVVDSGAQAKSGPRSHSLLAKASRFHPVPRDRWEVVDSATKKTLLHELRTHYRGLDRFKDDALAIRRWRLSFYESFDYYELEATGGSGPRKAYFLRAPGEPIVLDGQSSHIHSLNAKCGLALTRSQALDYLFFFTTSLDTEKGRFLIIDEIEDLTFKRQPDAEYLEAIEALIEPVQFLDDASIPKSDGPNVFLITANVLYGDTLFRALFKIPAHGSVEMVEDDSLMSNMPVVTDKEMKDFRLNLVPRVSQS